MAQNDRVNFMNQMAVAMNPQFAPVVEMQRLQQMEKERQKAAEWLNAYRQSPNEQVRQTRLAGLPDVVQDPDMVMKLQDFAIKDGQRQKEVQEQTSLQNFLKEASDLATPSRRTGKLPSIPEFRQDMLAYGTDYGYSPEVIQKGVNSLEPFIKRNAEIQKFGDTPVLVDQDELTATQVPGFEPQPEMPYKIGSLQDFYRDGKKFQGVFTGLDQAGQPQFSNPQEVPGKESGEGTDKYIMDLRKEFSSIPEVKDYSQIYSQVQRLDEAIQAANQEGGSKIAVDQALITTFNKMMDPTSVVRESEYARTPEDMAVLNRIKGKWDKGFEGGAGLTDEDRLAIYQMAQKFGEIASRKYREQADFYRREADRLGIDPSRIIRFNPDNFKTNPAPEGFGLPKGQEKPNEIKFLGFE